MEIQALTLKTIVKKFGTPTYVYDLDRIKKQYRFYMKVVRYEF